MSQFEAVDHDSKMTSCAAMRHQQTLVILEPELKNLARSGRSLVSAALLISQEVHVLVLGKDNAALASAAATVAGVTKVIWATDSSLTPILAESAAACVLFLSQAYDVILAPASTFGKNLLPRVAAKLDVSQVSEVTRILDASTVEHPIYAGHALETVRMLDEKKVMTIRTTAFLPVEGTQPSCGVENLTTSFNASKIKYVDFKTHASKRPELSQASVIVSGGRGLQSGEKFKLIEALADCLGAAVGASRAAVDAGFVPNDYQIGQTGKIVAPQLYFAIGISGAIQHIAGMQEAKVIVAINKDVDAPIFQVATYGLVGDLFEIVPKLIQLLKAEK